MNFWIPSADRAELFAQKLRLEVGDRIGEGHQGSVFQLRDKDCVHSVVKVHHRPPGFRIEVAVYERLR